jgi:hypothetical protein
MIDIVFVHSGTGIILHHDAIRVEVGTVASRLRQPALRDPFNGHKEQPPLSELVKRRWNQTIQRAVIGLETTDWSALGLIYRFRDDRSRLEVKG